MVEKVPDPKSKIQDRDCRGPSDLAMTETAGFQVFAYALSGMTLFKVLPRYIDTSILRYSFPSWLLDSEIKKAP